MLAAPMHIRTLNRTLEGFLDFLRRHDTYARVYALRICGRLDAASGNPRTARLSGGKCGGYDHAERNCRSEDVSFPDHWFLSDVER
jgi:hypothetical protein